MPSRPGALAGRAAAAVLVAALSGCGWVSVPPQGPSAGAPAAPPPPASAQEPGVAGRSYTVVHGDTVFGIGRKENVPARIIILANGLQPPYALTPGQTLTIPSASAVHTVKPGETLSAVARRYRTDVPSLAAANRLGPPYAIRAGQALLLPEGAAGSRTQVASAPPGPSGSGVIPPGRPEPRPSGVRVDAQPLAPPGGQAAAPPAGPQGALPPPTPVVPQSSAGPAPQEPAAAAPPAASSAPPTPSVPDAQPGASPGAAPPPVATAEPPPTPATAPLVEGGRGFLMPLKGPILSSFGAKDSGLRNDGINIGAALGTPVHAAADGVVAYTGNELPGFGNLVLIKHADGWVTAYGHNSEIVVHRGERVKRGQVISRVGQTGNVTQPQLHFELRRGSRAVDPLPYLSGYADQSG